MKYRKLRIAWSVVLGLVAVLLIVLWVRSYKSQDRFSIGQFANRGWAVESAVGQIAFQLYPINHNAHWFKWTQSATSDSPSGPAENYFGFNFYVGHDYAGVVVPHWLFVLLTAYLAACMAVGRVILFRFGPMKPFRRYLRIAFSIT